MTPTLMFEDDETEALFNRLIDAVERALNPRVPPLDRIEASAVVLAIALAGLNDE